MIISQPSAYASPFFFAKFNYSTDKFTGLIYYSPYDDWSAYLIYSFLTEYIRMEYQLITYTLWISKFSVIILRYQKHGLQR